MRMRTDSFRLLLALGALAGGVLLVAPRTVSANATLTIINNDGPGEGFNDPTLAAPVGGNPGTTIGQQRLIAFQFAADIWGATLDSNVPISILANFDPLTCTATSAVLGSAGTIFIFANFTGATGTYFPGAEFTDTWYGQALANKRAGEDQDPTPANADIRARFNSNLGNVGCLTGIGWYLGLDGNHGTQIDLVTVLLHEFGHGLGFQQFASVTTGSQVNGLTDIYGRHILDLTTGKYWNQMTNAERAASAINTRHVVWDGPAVNAALPGVLQAGTPLLRVNSPGSIAGVYAVGAAAFGPQLSSPGVTGDVLLVNDGVAPVTNGCEALAAGSLTGKIALIDRGVCTFVFKVKNAQDAGAIAVIIADNVAGAPPVGLGGTDPTITIPSVRITLADGNTLKAALASGTVNVTLGVDLSVRAGADPTGHALLYTPNPVAPGSTISHWDTSAFPNQLMEPAINDDLTHSVMPPQDLTLPLMRDIGWFPDANLNGVDDSCEPPAVTAVSATPTSLWPADHTMHDITVSYALDPNCPDPVCTLSVTSDEPVDGTGDGDLAPDWEIVDAHHVRLRAERAGSGDGRVYTITVSCTYGPGSTTNEMVTVTVPHDQRNRGRGQTRDIVTGSQAPTVVSFGYAGGNLGARGASFQFGMPSRSNVELAIFDVAGRRVATLLRGDLDAGWHDATWRPQPSEAAAGVYFARLAVGERFLTRRVLLLR